MNTLVRRVSVVIALMFVAIMAAATNIQFVTASDLNADGRNVRTVYREFGQDRGPIVIDGTSIASSSPIDDAYNYLREYHEPYDYAHITGYFSVAHASITGLEQAGNEVLNGSAPSLLTQRIQTLITGNQPRGGAIDLTVDPAVQQAAIDGLGDQRGAAMAIDPDTGQILAMYSSPSFDPNDISTHDFGAARDNYDSLADDETDPLINRAIGGDQYAPGSIFKVVTAASMIENGMSADSVLDAPTEFQLPQSTQIMNNPGQLACGDGSGQATLLESFRQSCNTPFAISAIEMGDEELRATAEDFGFGEQFEIPMTSSAARFPGEPSDAELAMTSIGQFDLMVTPLQMLMVSSAIANDGVQMQPYLIDRTLNADLEEVSVTNPSELRTAVSADTAEELTSLMVEAVANGTGTNAQIPGVDVAGKTGTAEVTADIPPHAWFTGFAPADDPEIAVIVVVENGGNLGWGAGGAELAAPIAQTMMEARL